MQGDHSITEIEDLETTDEENPVSTENSTIDAPQESVSLHQGRALTSSDNQETSVWDNAVELLKENGIKDALALLFNASTSALSVREKNRYRLYMAKLCLKAKRVDLAKPILEELNTLIEELQLERWESPTWVGEILEALYQCLTSADERFQDPDRAAELLKHPGCGE